MVVWVLIAFIASCGPVVVAQVISDSSIQSYFGVCLAIKKFFLKIKYCLYLVLLTYFPYLLTTFSKDARLSYT